MPHVRARHVVLLIYFSPLSAFLAHFAYTICTRIYSALSADVIYTYTYVRVAWLHLRYCNNAAQSLRFPRNWSNSLKNVSNAPLFLDISLHSPCAFDSICLVAPVYIFPPHHNIYIRIACITCCVCYETRYDDKSFVHRIQVWPPRARLSFEVHLRDRTATCSPAKWLAGRPNANSIYVSARPLTDAG